MACIAYSLAKNKGPRREVRCGDVRLRTIDLNVDLDADWDYRKQMIEVCEYFDVSVVNLRSDRCRNVAGSVSILVNPPKTADRLRGIAHEAAHIGLRHLTSGISRHRMEYETGTFEIRYLEYCGLVPTEKMVLSGKRYVANIIRMAIRRGIRRFDREAWDYAGQLVEAYQLGIVPELYDGSQDNGYREAMEHFTPGR